MDNDDRREMALWRVAVLGPLISARLEHGQRCELFSEAAARTHQRPDGRWVRLSARTVEAWYYACRRGGLQALMPKRRGDRGESRAIAEHEYGFKQALLKYGRPRTCYIDLGSAYVAGSLREITAELGIRLLHTEPRDCEAKGVIERWHGTWR